VQKVETMKILNCIPAPNLVTSLIPSLAFMTQVPSTNSIASQSSKLFGLLGQLKSHKLESDLPRSFLFLKHHGLHVVLESKGCESKQDRLGREALRRPSLWGAWKIATRNGKLGH